MDVILRHYLLLADMAKIGGDPNLDEVVLMIVVVAAAVEDRTRVLLAPAPAPALGVLLAPAHLQGHRIPVQHQ